MSEWKTRITKVQALRPKGSSDAACLVMIYPPGSDLGRRFPLDATEYVVGRGADCDIQVDLDSVSRRHARVYRTEQEWVVEDLGSTNGSYLNDGQIQEASLRDGDFLKIGAAIFKFLTGANIEVSYHEEIYRMTIMDGLTGIHNKRFFLEALEKEMARCARHGRPLSLCMIDIDHFKKVNDDHGHLTGDHVLKELARRMSGRMRKEEILSRYGGEEFAVILPETGRIGALEFGEQIRQIIAREPFEYEGDALPITISLGVATIEGEFSTGPMALDAAGFIKAADENLYKAKHAGRNRVVG